MKTVRRAAIVVVVVAGLAGVVWMFAAPVAGDRVIGNAQVLGALAGVAGVLAGVVVLWRRGSRRGEEPLTPGQAQAAITYLANETLRYWLIQAKERRIHTPSPASVRWTWADVEVAVPAAELQPELPVAADGPMPGQSPRLLTAGTVTELRQQLYDRLDDTRSSERLLRP